MDGTGDFENWRSAFEHLVAIASQTKCDAEIEIQHLGSSPNKLMLQRLGLEVILRFPNHRFRFCSSARALRDQRTRIIAASPAGNRRSTSPRPGLRYIAGTEHRAGDPTMRKRRSAEAPVDGRCRPREPVPGAFQPQPDARKSLDPLPCMGAPRPKTKWENSPGHTAPEDANGRTVREWPYL